MSVYVDSWVCKNHHPVIDTTALFNSNLSFAKKGEAAAPLHINRIDENAYAAAMACPSPKKTRPTGQCFSRSCDGTRHGSPLMPPAFLTGSRSSLYTQQSLIRRRLLACIGAVWWEFPVWEASAVMATWSMLWRMAQAFANHCFIGGEEDERQSATPHAPKKNGMELMSRGKLGAWFDLVRIGSRARLRPEFS